MKLSELLKRRITLLMQAATATAAAPQVTTILPKDSRIPRHTCPLPKQDFLNKPLVKSYDKFQ